MDRCALFVDASYVLADGAMAVHGTRRRESVSWDYGGLLQLLGNLAMERSGLPLLRCYWYEIATDDRRTAEQDALADMPGVKLRLVKSGPGRDGVEREMHRDLTALARNQAVSDAMVVSSAEELTRVVADVQDLGMRVTLLHIAADGNWTISRTLRQECDDIVEISPSHLRPYVELISGAEPPRPDEQEGGALIALRPHLNGHVAGGQTTGYAPVPPESSNGHGHQTPAVAPTGPAAWGLPPPALPAPEVAPEAPAPGVTAPGAPAPEVPREAPLPARPPAGPSARPPNPQPVGQDDAHDYPAAGDLLAGLAAIPVKRPDAPQDVSRVAPETASADFHQDQSPARVARHGAAEARQDLPVRRDLPVGPPGQPVPGPDTALPAERSANGEPPAHGNSAPRELPARRGFTAYQDLFAAPVVEAPAPPPAPLTPPGPPDERAAGSPTARPRSADLSGYNPGAMREPLPRQADSGPQPVADAHFAQVSQMPARGPGYPPSGGQPVLPLPTGAHAAGAPPTQGPQPVPGPPQGPEVPPPPPVPQPELSQPGPAQPVHPVPPGPVQPGQPGPGQPGQPGPGQPGQPAGPDVPLAPTYTPSRNGTYSGPQPSVSLRQVGTGPSPALSPNGLAGPANSAPAPAEYGSSAYGQPEYPPPAYGRPEFARPGYGQAGDMVQSGAGTGPAPAGPTGSAGPLAVAGPVDPPPSNSGVPGDPGAPVGPGSPANSSGPLGMNGPPNVSGPGNPGVPVSPGGPIGPGVPAGPGAPVPGSQGFQPGTLQPAISLADAVQSAHEEGQEFGGSVARDAPTLWLEAVLARKPRMPSDLEARLLQGSSLPIDFLLHDEVRHALRRGFWDALERARR